MARRCLTGHFLVISRMIIKEAWIRRNALVGFNETANNFDFSVGDDERFSGIRDDALQVKGVI